MTHPVNRGWLVLLVEVVVAIIVYILIVWLTDPWQYPAAQNPAAPNDNPILKLSWELLWVFVAIPYIIASIRVWQPIPPDKIGVRIILGIPTDTVTSGPPVVPPLLGSVELFPTATEQREFPDEPEKLFRPLKDESQAAPAGMKPPLRINFSDSVKETDLDAVFGPMDRLPIDGGLQWVWRPGTTIAERTAVTIDANGPKDVTKIFRFNPKVPNDGLSTARVTAEVSHISRLRVVDAVTLVKAIAPNIKTGLRLDEIFKQIEDEQTIALNSILTKISVAQAQANVDWLNAILFSRVEARIKATDGHSDSWGIDLEGAALKPFSFNRSLNDAITGVAASSFAADSTIRAAEAAKQETILKGQGAAQAARDLESETLRGRGEGLAAAATASGLSAKEMLGADIADSIAKGDGTIILGDSGLASLAAIGTTLNNNLKK